MNKLPTTPTQLDIINKIDEIVDYKQDTLVSGTNIKTINNESLLGSGNINISGGGGTATDVQINGTSITSNNVANIVTNTAYNASSNKIATMSDLPTGYLQNKATGTNSLTLLGTATSSNKTINIGYNTSTSKSGCVTIGTGCVTGGLCSIALGYSATASKASAIQLGTGTNSTANTLSVGFYNNGNYQLLDGTTGKIPSDRLNIATSVSSSSTNAETVGAKLFYDTVGNLENILHTINSGNN